MGYEKGLKYIYAQEHKLYHDYYYFRGHWGNKNWKNDKKMLEAYFFQQRWKETVTNTVMASRFWLSAYIVQLFDFHFSLVYFIRLKYR